MLSYFSVSAATTVSGADAVADGGEDDALLGTVLSGRYRLESVLGVGGVGVVYAAEHTGVRLPVAVKVLRAGFEAVPHVIRRFEREAKLLAGLTHPHVVGLNDFGVHEGMPYLVMERLEGRSLEQLLDVTVLDPRRALDIFRAVVRGLAFAHGRGVLHRDLKPGNVFLQRLPDDPEHPKLLDFGLAKLVSGEEEQSRFEPTLTRAGTILGTPAYMAPEQASGAQVDARADVYSAGVMLFEMLVGRPPFSAERRTDLLKKHLLEPVPDPESMRPGLRLGPALSELLLRTLHKDAARRFADGAALLAAVDALPDDAARLDAKGDITREVLVGSLEGRMARTPRARALPIAVAIAVLALGTMAWMWVPASTSEVVASGVADEVAEDEFTEHQVAPSMPIPMPPVRPEDPFATPLPAELARLAERLESSDELDRATHRATRRYQRLHLDDPRPSLLLARDLASRGSWSAAVERYALAIERWPDSRRDPHAIRDLVRAAEREENERAALDSLRGFDSRRVDAEFERRLAESEDRIERATLVRLRRSL